MLIGQLRYHAATGRALDESLHDEERLIDLLYGACILADGGGDGRDAHGPALELVDDGQQDAVVYFVQTVLVDVQCGQRQLGDVDVDAAVTLYLCEVAYTAQQGIGKYGACHDCDGQSRWKRRRKWGRRGWQPSGG